MFFLSFCSQWILPDIWLYYHYRQNTSFCFVFESFTVSWFSFPLNSLISRFPFFFHGSPLLYPFLLTGPRHPYRYYFLYLLIHHIFLLLISQGFIRSDFLRSILPSAVSTLLLFNPTTSEFSFKDYIFFISRCCFSFSSLSFICFS